MMDFIKGKKIFFFGLLFGFVLLLGVSVFAQQHYPEDSWLVGNGWIWFKQVIGSDGQPAFDESHNPIIRGNVQTPIEGENIANKNYVMSATAGETASGAQATCTAFSCGEKGCGVVCCGPSQNSTELTKCRVYDTNSGDWGAYISI